VLCAGMRILSINDRNLKLQCFIYLLRAVQSDMVVNIFCCALVKRGNRAR
jgi:hypothetical protein